MQTQTVKIRKAVLNASVNKDTQEMALTATVKMINASQSYMASETEVLSHSDDQKSISSKH